MPERRYELGSLERAIEILQMLATRPGLRLKDLGEALGAHQTTVLRALRVLERHRLVRRQEHGGYVLGGGLAELGQAALEAIDIARDLRPLTAQLADLVGVTAHVGLVRDGEVVIIDKVDGPQPMVRYSTLGSHMPMHATAAGKAALALDSAEWERLLLQAHLPQVTPATITEPHALLRQVERARGDRFATEQSEFRVGFGCVAVAFRVTDDLVTLSLSGPLVDRATLDDRGRLLVDHVAEFLRPYGASAVQL